MELTKTDVLINDLRSNLRSKQIYARKAGYKKPFFDYISSYKSEFENIVNKAKNQFPSLVGVFETNNLHVNTFTDFGIPESWVRLEYDDGNHGDDYITRTESGSPTGVAISFETLDKELKTLVLINKKGTTKFNVMEHKYVDKIAALLHELGHVDDFEKSINFNRSDRVCQIKDAEVYAHKYAIRCCFENGYAFSHKVLLDTISSLSKMGGVESLIAEEVTAFADSYPVQEWIDFLPKQQLRS